MEHSFISEESLLALLNHYLHSSEWEPDANFVDGKIEERPMGEDDHSAWQLAIQLWFSRHAEEWQIKIRPELRVQVTKNNFLVADVAILRASTPKERIAVTPPLAVFEVWSSLNNLRNMLRNLRLYKAMGIPQIWMVDPEDGIWQFVDREKGELVETTTFSESNIQFDMTEINKLVR